MVSKYISQSALRTNKDVYKRQAKFFAHIIRIRVFYCIHCFVRLFDNIWNEALVRLGFIPRATVFASELADYIHKRIDVYKRQN